jgi:hypothetical protein
MRPLAAIESAVQTVLLVLLLSASMGCAAASSQDGWTLAMGADATAQVYGDCPAPLLLPEGLTTTEKREQSIDRTFPRADETRVTTVTTPAELAQQTLGDPPLLLESKGSAFLEPLAKVIGEVGVAFGTAAGRVVVCVITLGWRCGP